MNNESNSPFDAKAYRAFINWIDEGKKLWSMFEQEGIPVPPSLKRALTDERQGSSQVRKTSARQPEKPEMPTGAGDDWLWIDEKEASLRTIVLAILNEGKPIATKDIIKRVKEIDPKAVEGSIYNIGAQEEKIQKTDQGWELKDGTEAPVLYKNHIWAPRNLLLKQDLAAFRRMAIRNLLATSPDGLQIMQVYRLLQNADWLKTPLSKDLVKADLMIMKTDKKVKQLGNSKKWTLHNDFEEDK